MPRGNYIKSYVSDCTKTKRKCCWKDCRKPFISIGGSRQCPECYERNEKQSRLGAKWKSSWSRKTRAGKEVGS